MANKTVTFTCRPETATYSSDSFRIYACDVNRREFPEIKDSVYGSVTLKGSFPELTLGADYEVTATEQFDARYKFSYYVQYIQPKQVKTAEDIRTFMSTILSEKKVDTLLKVYPDILDRIMNNQPVDLNLVKGVKAKTFERLRQKVASHYSMYGAITEFSHIFTPGMLKKLMETYESTSRIKEELILDPYRALMRIQGVGYKTVENILTTKYDALTKTFGNDYLKDIHVSTKRLMACAEDIIADIEQGGSTIVSMTELKALCEERCSEAFGHFDEIYSDSRFVFLGDDKIMRIETFTAENGIANTLHDLVKAKNEWFIDPEPYRNIGDLTLTDDQFSMLRLILNNNVVILNGYAGSGKSQSTMALINMLRDNGKTCCCLAPTGRAAKVLSAYTGMDASTIHRALGYNGQWDDSAQITDDIVILDEVSMVDVFTFYHLLKAIDPSRTKLLLIGDDAQLASVGCGNILHDMLDAGTFATVTLDKIFRYGRGGLSTVATDIRKGRQYLKMKDNSVKMVGSDKSYGFIPTIDDNIVTGATVMYIKLLDLGYTTDEICVLAAYNTGKCGTIAINESIQNAVNRSPETFEASEKRFRLGDPVINTKNNYEAKLYDANFHYVRNDFVANGEIGKIIEICAKSIFVAFGDRIISYTAFDNLQLAYAISCHKSQGGAFKAVILATPKCQARLLSSNLLYVGVTRAQEKCYHIGDAKTVNNAVAVKEQVSRETFLKNRLNIITITT